MVGLACADAQRSGVTAESVKAATKARQMTLEEAEKILGIDSKMSYDEVLKVRQFWSRHQSTLPIIMVIVLFSLCHFQIT